MIHKHHIKQLRQVAVVVLLCIGLFPTGAVAMRDNMQAYRPPSKQHVLLKKLGLEEIRLREEAAEDVNRGEATSTRRVLYLPSNPGELAIGLCMLLDHAKQDEEGPATIAFMHDARSAPDSLHNDYGYHADSGRLVAVRDGEVSKGPQHKRIEVDLQGWREAYPEKCSVLPQADWQTLWPGGTGLQLNMPEGPLHVYFPTRYGGFAPTSNYRKTKWYLDWDYQGPERVPVLLGHKLYTIQMLHALASEEAPKFDALWVLYDSGMRMLSSDDHLYFDHGSHLRTQNQSNDYAHHQTLRWGTNLNSPEEREAFYTKMWDHMQRHSEPDLMEQLRALEAEEDVPYLRELEEEGRLDEKLWPEQPFTFRQMSLLQAYGTMNLPMCAGDWGCMGETKDGEEIGSEWDRGEIWVHGGAELPVPDGLWDGRFKLFPHPQAHMINLGLLECNDGGIVPFMIPRGAYNNFRDGVHCGFAKRENIWWLGSDSKTVANLNHVALLVQSVWDAPGRFYYEKVVAETVPEPVPVPPLPEPEEDRKPAAQPRGTLPPVASKEANTQWQCKALDDIPLSTSKIHFIRLFKKLPKKVSWEDAPREQQRETEVLSYGADLKHNAEGLERDELFDVERDISESLRNSHLWEPRKTVRVDVEDGMIVLTHGTLKTYLPGRWGRVTCVNTPKQSRIRNFEDAGVAAHNNLNALQAVNETPWPEGQVGWLVLNADLCAGEVEHKQVHEEQREQILQARIENTCDMIGRITGMYCTPERLNASSFVIPREGYQYDVRETSIINNGNAEIQQTYWVYPNGVERSQMHAYVVNKGAVPAPPLPEPEEDRKPAARPTERPVRDEAMLPFDSLIEENPESSKGWWSSIWREDSTPTAATLTATSTAMVPLIAKNPKTAAVGLGFTAVIGGVYYHYNNAQPSKRVSALSDKLELKFASDEDGKAFKVDISCNGESIKTTLKQEREDTRNLCISPESTHSIHNMYLLVLLEDPTGKVTIQEVMKGAIHEVDWLRREQKIEDNVTSVLKSMVKNVKGTSSWNWGSFKNNVSKPNTIGYLCICYPAAIISSLKNREPLHKLEQAILARLEEEDPGSRIYSKNWADSDEAKQSPYADDIHIRIITTRGDIKFSTNPPTA